MSNACCRGCGAPLSENFADLGMSPLANAIIPPARAQAMEPRWPLHAFVCSACRLVQLEEFETPERIFATDYSYFSSFSDSWLRHAEAYAAQMTARLGLGPAQLVVEMGSNDGYLLQYFAGAGVPVLGVEPAGNCAAAAVARGVPTEVAFFGTATARRLRESGRAADLLIGNNVLAHVPDLHDVLAGCALLLRPEGIASFEFPHLLRLIAENQFDTIYHEHFCYFSLLALEPVLRAEGLAPFDVERLPTHGGSLRLFVAPVAAGRAETAALAALRAEEAAAGLEHAATYAAFAARVVECKNQLLEFLIAAQRAGQTVAGYGAPAKGNTLLNYCGVGPAHLPFTVDRSPHKQGHLLPGTRIPIRGPEAVFAAKPDYLLILPWNLREEIMQQMAGIRAWGGRFVVPIPELTVLP